MSYNRLYVITRRDLKRGLKIAQACHAVFESPRSLGFSGSEAPYLVVLEVEDEERLIELLERTSAMTSVVSWREPDLNDQLTAIAFFDNGGTRSLTEGLRLAG